MGKHNKDFYLRPLPKQLNVFFLLIQNIKNSPPKQKYVNVYINLKLLMYFYVEDCLFAASKYVYSLRLNGSSCGENEDLLEVVTIYIYWCLKVAGY